MKRVKLTEYFDICSPLQDDKINFIPSDIKDEESVPFLGRSSQNNGIVDYVKPREGYINNGGVLTVALDGSTGSTYYQKHPFSSGQNIWILKPLKDKIPSLDNKTALFLVTTIKKAVEMYSYNLSLTKGRLSKIYINLPVKRNNTLDIEYINELMSSLHNISMLDKVSEKKY